MSLTRRLVFLVLIAVIGLVAAAVALVRLHLQSASARERAAFAQGELVTGELLAKWQALNKDATHEGALASSLAPLAPVVSTLIAPLLDASAGYCLRDGTLVLRQTIAPFAFQPPPGRQSGPPADLSRPFHFHPPTEFSAQLAPDLLPLDRDVVAAACREQNQQVLRHVRFAAPNDLLFVTVQKADSQLSSWALVRMPNRGRDPANRGWIPLILLIGLTMVALVGLSMEAVRTLQRGSAELAQSFLRLQDDLHAEIPVPRAKELAHIAEGLREMTATLTSSLARERMLERRLDHENRLAALGRVVAGVAHEIRNPLTGIKLRLDSMARRRLDERTATDVSKALVEIARLDGVVGSLLIIARRTLPAKNTVDLAALVDSRLEQLEEVAAAQSVQLRRAGDGTGLLDAESMARVIDNLVRNAIEATPKNGEVLVRISSEKNVLSLRVEDCGPGVAKEHESQLFEPFFTSKPGGTGLGLCLSRAAVEAHDGALRYERVNGQTAFVVQLPIKAVA